MAMQCPGNWAASSLLIRWHGLEALTLRVLPEIRGGEQRMLSGASAINLAMVRGLGHGSCRWSHHGFKK